MNNYIKSTPTAIISKNNNNLKPISKERHDNINTQNHKHTRIMTITPVIRHLKPEQNNRITEKGNKNILIKQRDISNNTKNTI